MRVCLFILLSLKKDLLEVSFFQSKKTEEWSYKTYLVYWLKRKEKKRSVLSKVILYYTVFKQSLGILPYLVPVLWFILKVLVFKHYSQTTAWMLRAKYFCFHWRMHAPTVLKVFKFGWEKMRLYLNLQVLNLLYSNLFGLRFSTSTSSFKYAVLRVKTLTSSVCVSRFFLIS